MSKRYCYPGMNIPAGKLPFDLTILPSGAVYAKVDQSLRRLTAILTRPGLAIEDPNGEQILIVRDGTMFVGDEIKTLIPRFS